MNRNFKKVYKFIPYIIYLILIMHSYYEFKAFPSDEKEFFVRIFYSIQSMFYSLGILIVLKLYFSTIPFMEPIYYIRYKEDKFNGVYKYFLVNILKMEIFVICIMILFCILLKIKIDLMLIRMWFHILLFIIFEILLFVNIYLLSLKKLFSNICIFIINIMSLITYFSYKYDYLNNTDKGIDLKSMDFFSIVISFFIIILMYIFNKKINSREII